MSRTQPKTPKNSSPVEPGKVQLEKGQDGRFIISAWRRNEKVSPKDVCGLLRRIEGVDYGSMKIINDAVHFRISPMFEILEIQDTLKCAIKKRMRWARVQLIGGV